MKVNATGKVGVVYTTKTGQREYDFDHHEGEGSIGWHQVSTTERECVIRKRSGHMSVLWCRHDEEKPFSHKDDGPIA